MTLNARKEKAQLTFAFERPATENKIRGLISRLYKLAPHPDKHQNIALNLRSAFNPHDECDGMMGSLIMSMLAAPAFTMAINDNFNAASAHVLNNLDVNTLLDCAGEYLKDTEKSYKPEITGAGTFAMGAHKTTCNSFKSFFANARMAAYMRDLPERQRIESALTDLVRAYDTLSNIQDEPLPALTA